MSDLKETAIAAIDECKDDLNAISTDIWQHPEINFEERHAHSAITQFLEDHGFPVERNFVIETGFRSVFGSAEFVPHVAILCEYDALPEIGHACGHNLITEVGLAAGIGLKAAFEANGQPLGKVTILGTPAEEGGGGKIDMLNAGVFKDVDVAMMAHPMRFNSEIFRSLAMERVRVFYHGTASHAAAFPWEGINALDAAVMCYQSVACMLKQLKPSWRAHGVIRNGGTKPNIIPELTELEYYAWTSTASDLQLLKVKLNQSFQAAADSTGCKVDIQWQGRAYYDIINNGTVAQLYRDNAVKAGVDFEGFPADRCGGDVPTASTDMGNVSYEVPSIHPIFYIGADTLNHTREYTESTGDISAQQYTLCVGKALAMTTLDIMTRNDELLPRIKQELGSGQKFRHWGTD